MQTESAYITCCLPTSSISIINEQQYNSLRIFQPED
uniref:Uncharacterized protein n=1 Tax=Onchocerca volvulus TaxID=6282 RepID=A0A8R1Y100_ONCVO